jgi:hypothetical protein
MGGGDLLNLLIERDIFEEDFTRFYVAEVRCFLPSQFFVVAILNLCLLSHIDDSGDRVLPQTRFHSP